MLMMMLRIGLVVLGAGGLTEAAVVALVISNNPIASNGVMYFGFMLIALQMVLSVGLLAAGLWLPVHRWIRSLAGRPD